MTRYYFDVRDNTGLYPDEEGLDFATQREAEVEAAEALVDMARDLALRDERQDFAVEVRTGTTRVFQAALTFKYSRPAQ